MKKQKLNKVTPFALAVFSCSFLSSCGNSAKKDALSAMDYGTSSFELYFEDENHNWQLVSANSLSTYDFSGATSDQAEFTFKVINNGDSHLQNTSPTVVSKITADTNPDSYGPNTTSFSLLTSPNFPIAPGEESIFKIRLSSSCSASYCSLSAKKNESPYDWHSYDKIKINFATNDPTNTTFEASLVFLGVS